MYIRKSSKTIPAFEMRELRLRSRDMLKVTLIIDVTKKEFESMFSALSAAMGYSFSPGCLRRGWERANKM